MRGGGESLAAVPFDADSKQRRCSKNSSSSRPGPHDVTLNHTCFTTRNPAVALEFLEEVLGFRKVMAWK